MELSNERQQLFEQMEQELKEYNEALRQGLDPVEPVYDQEVFMEFRGWQSARLTQRALEQGLLDKPPLKLPPLRR